MRAKNPQTPPPRLVLKPSDVVTYGAAAPLFRIHRVQGQRPSAWNGLREHGPLRQMRWEPHPAPHGNHPGRGVAYCATEPITAFAEVFQHQHLIHLTADQALTAWFPTRTLRLLDLTQLWAVNNGASASLHAAPKSTCSAWATAIADQSIEDDWQLDGLWVPSTMTLTPMVVLFAPAASAYPAAPHLSALLTAGVARTLAVKAGHALGWRVI